LVSKIREFARIQILIIPLLLLYRMGKNNTLFTIFLNVLFFVNINKILEVLSYNYIEGIPSSGFVVLGRDSMCVVDNLYST